MVTVREIGVFDNDEEGVGDLFFSFFLLIGGGDFVCKSEKFWKRNSIRCGLSGFGFYSTLVL